MHAKSLQSCLFVTPWTVALQASLSMGFSRQEYWRGLPCPPPGDLPDPGIEPTSFISPAFASRFFTTSATWEAQCADTESWIHTSPPYTNSGRTLLYSWGESLGETSRRSLEQTPRRNPERSLLISSLREPRGAKKVTSALHPLPSLGGESSRKAPTVISVV